MVWAGTLWGTDVRACLGMYVLGTYGLDIVLGDGAWERANVQKSSRADGSITC